MPIFEFNCQECNSEFEELVRSSDTMDIKCPECGSERTRKLFSSFASIGDARGKASGSSCSSCKTPTN